MVKLQNVLKTVCIAESLVYLTGSYDNETYLDVLCRYYSAYAAVVYGGYKTIAPPKTHALGVKDTIIITGYVKNGGGEDAEYIMTAGSTKNNLENPFFSEICWEDFWNDEAEIFVADNIINVIDDMEMRELFAADLLCRMEKSMPDGIPRVRDKKIWDMVISVRKEIGQESYNEIVTDMEKSISKECSLSEIKKELDSFRARDNTVFDWELLMTLDTSSEVKKYYKEMNTDITPSARRFRSRMGLLSKALDDMEFTDFYTVRKKQYKIVLAKNNSNPDFPIAYVVGADGKKKGINEFDLQKLICMEIYVTDKDINSGKQVLAILSYYMEYPIRVERIQREGLITELIGIRFKSA